MSSVETIYNFVQINNRIATSGQPTVEEFSDIKNAGYDLVINLAVPSSKNALPNEKEIVESFEMQYVHIPVIWENPTLEDIQQFFDVMNHNAEKNAFVHCAMNMRVSAFMYLYQRIYQHKDDQEAKANLTKIWTPNETWQNFIEYTLKRFENRSLA